MDIHGNYSRNVWTTEIRHSVKQLTRKTIDQPQILLCRKTPGLWRHLRRPISFTFEVKNVGISYVVQEQAYHLMGALKFNYEESQ